MLPDPAVVERESARDFLMLLAVVALVYIPEEPLEIPGSVAETAVAGHGIDSDFAAVNVSVLALAKQSGRLERHGPQDQHVFPCQASPSQYVEVQVRLVKVHYWLALPLPR